MVSKGVYYAQIQIHPYIRIYVYPHLSNPIICLTPAFPPSFVVSCSPAEMHMCETHDDGTAQKLGKRHHERRRPFCIGRATLQVKQTSKQAIHHVQRLFILHLGLPARKALEKHQLRGCSASEVKQGPSLGRSASSQREGSEI